MRIYKWRDIRGKIAKLDAEVLIEGREYWLVPKDTGLTLDTLVRAAEAVGLEVTLFLRPKEVAKKRPAKSPRRPRRKAG